MQQLMLFFTLNLSLRLLWGRLSVVSEGPAPGVARWFEERAGGREEQETQRSGGQTSQTKDEDQGVISTEYLM